MSESTFTVRPLSDAEKQAIEKLYGNVGSKLCHCWLCGARVNIRKYADHAAKHRREGWIPRPINIPKRAAVEVFAEWQQRDATADELAE